MFGKVARRMGRSVAPCALIDLCCWEIPPVVLAAFRVCYGLTAPAQANTVLGRSLVGTLDRRIGISSD
jgi:hypothetical protein